MTDAARLKQHPNRFHSVSFRDPISAREHNQLVDAFNRQFIGVELPRQLSNLGDDEGSGVRQRFKIFTIAGDYLVCSPWDGFTDSDERINVARPYLLRTSLESHNSVTFVFTDDVTRTASATGEDDETQVIVPAYVIDDEIWATRDFIGGTGAISDTDEEIEWLDDNRDARAWAKQAG